MEEIKYIVEQWRDNKCIHCGTQMIFIDDDFRCPNCIWNDSVSSNGHTALLKIGTQVGAIFFMSGASVA